MQLVTGRSSLTGEEVSRFWAAIGVVPVAGGVLKRVGKPGAEAISKIVQEIDSTGKLGNTESPAQAAAAKTTKRIPLAGQNNENWKSFINNEGQIQLDARSTQRVEKIINETLSGNKNFTSSMKITTDEALAAGQKYLGAHYRDIGKPGSGVFYSADGTREFRIDS